MSNTSDLVDQAGRKLSLEENGGFLALPLLMFSNASLALSNYFILVDDKEMYPE